jgi:hypothetical protein
MQSIANLIGQGGKLAALTQTNDTQRCLNDLERDFGTMDHVTCCPHFTPNPLAGRLLHPSVIPPPALVEEARNEDRKRAVKRIIKIFSWVKIKDVEKDSLPPKFVQVLGLK